MLDTPFSSAPATGTSPEQATERVPPRPAPLTLEAYTFLRDDLGSLDVTLTAYDAKDYVIAERTLENIPMKNRMVTEYSGALFSSSSVNELGFTFTGETDWEVYQHLSD